MLENTRFPTLRISLSYLFENLIICIFYYFKYICMLYVTYLDILK
nr:MAG TPA: hypothetical protein [Caudoviricetes sp.]